VELHAHHGVDEAAHHDLQGSTRLTLATAVNAARRFFLLNALRHHINRAPHAVSTPYRPWGLPALVDDTAQAAALSQTARTRAL
jgi:hypothetical protein